MFSTAIFLLVFFCLALFAPSAFSQKSDEILATAAGRAYTIKSLKPEVQQAWINLSKTIGNARHELLAKDVTDLMLAAESAERKISHNQLLEEIWKKIPDPTEQEIKAVYDANRAAIGNNSLEEVRPEIILFLRREPEQKAYADYITKLKTKYKPLFPVEVNANNLKPSDILTSVAGKQIIVKDFESRHRLALFDIEADVYEKALGNLKAVVASDVLGLEAAERRITPSDIIAREITDRMREFSDEEREALQTALDNRLFAKYKAEFLLKAPQPVVQNISVDDDPFQGKVAAPVTVVMFSDFQCPACAATHPILKKVIAEYGDKVRFVVRDFPLTNIHENAFNAARAANAAQAQGKFFEYIEILYQNREALDAASLKKYAADLGLNLKQFDLDLNSEKNAAEINKDKAEGESYGITGTPTIFINGIKLRRLSASAIRASIDQALKK